MADRAARRDAPAILPLAAADLSWRAGDVEILREVSLRIEPGTRNIVIGPNGAGKSVLLRMLHGLLAPSGGSDWSRRCAARAARAGDGVPAAGDAAPLGAREHRVRAARWAGCASCARRRPGGAGPGRPGQPGGPAGAAVFRRRAAAHRAGARLGAAARRSCSSTSPRPASIRPRPGRSRKSSPRCMRRVRPS